MPFPIIPLVAIAMLIGGAGALTWYSNLSKEGKEKADRKANELARRLFKKSLKALTEAEANQVHDIVKQDYLR